MKISLNTDNLINELESEMKSSFNSKKNLYKILGADINGVKAYVNDLGSYMGSYIDSDGYQYVSLKVWNGNVLTFCETEIRKA